MIRSGRAYRRLWRLEWDEEKAQANQAKHDVRFEEAAQAFNAYHQRRRASTHERRIYEEER
jgi:uncharacterized DUF497 family protein